LGVAAVLRKTVSIFFVGAVRSTVKTTAGTKHTGHGSNVFQDCTEILTTGSAGPGPTRMLTGAEFSVVPVEFVAGPVITCGPPLAFFHQTVPFGIVSPRSCSPS